MTEPFAHRPARPKVAVIGGLMAYFESIMEAGFRGTRQAHVDATTAGLGDHFDLSDLGLWAEAGDAAAMTRRLRGTPHDVLLLVPTMATPPAELAALAQEANLPVVIACAHELSEITDSYDMRALCRHSGNVGATMLGAMLRRLERPIQPILVTGFLDDPTFHTRLSLALATAALSRRMDGLRVGRLGAPMPGYDHIALSAEQAAVSGIDVIDIPLAAWAARVGAVSDKDIAAAVHDTLPRLLPTGARYAPSADLNRAMRLALALNSLADEARLDCGSLTCRGPFGVGLNEGAIGCLATTLLTATGRPFSATGDLVTAIAMMIGRTLGGATLYCELDAIDRNRDAFLVANTGEGDIAWVGPGGKCDIHDASAHSGRQVPGVVLNHDLSAGPATMLGATLDRARSERLALIALEGHTQEPPQTGLMVTNGWFQTTRRPALSAFEDWANAGATHHGALSRGHLGEATGWLGQLCDLPVTQIPTNRSAQ